MKILHTSDWHLGRTLYAKKERLDEHNAFFDWLLNTINREKIDVLIIAGDVFDTSSPSSTSQKMYYDFLINVKTVGCKNVIVVGGNHDSPSFLNAPKDILSALNIVVIGNASENIRDEIILIKDNKENPALMVCAVPFLRERDISRFAEGESYSDRSKRINENIQKHYSEVAVRAEQMRTELDVNIPIIATGHLSVSGGKRTEDDGVRETYIGAIESVSSDIFPETFDYVALGHYHIPSVIKPHIRYSGSPIPMGFGEAEQQKQVYIIDFTQEKNISSIEIPMFQKLASIVGSKTEIAEQIDKLKSENQSVWVEIIYTGDEIFPDFSTWIEEQISDSKIEVLKLVNRQLLNAVLTQDDTTEMLDEMNEYDVFEKILEKNNISDEQSKILRELYNEILTEMQIEN